MLLFWREYFVVVLKFDRPPPGALWNCHAGVPPKMEGEAVVGGRRDEAFTPVPKSDVPGAADS